MTQYTVKRGDSLWKIAKTYPQYISGNTIEARINTLVSINGIKNRNVIRVGQILKFSGSAASSSTAAATNPNAAVISDLGLQSDSTTGRDVFASWSWHKMDDTHKNFKIRWEWDFPNSAKPGGYETKFQESETTDTWATFSIPSEFRKTVNWVQIFVTPIAKNKTNSKGEDTGKPHWTADRAGKQYKFADNPPKEPGSAPSVTIDKGTLTLRVSMDADPIELDASSIQFNVTRDNEASIATSDPIAINTATNHVAWTYTVEPGHTYRARARSVSFNEKESGWTEFSIEAKTHPSAPSDLKVSRETHIDENNQNKTYSVFAEWLPVTNADKYIVEYTNVKSNFDTNGASVSTAETTDNTPSLRISFSSDNIGYVYYFRVKANNSDGDSDPSAIVELPIGAPPGPPTTWSSSDSAFEGETMELNWIHNPTDNSKQSYAQIALKIGDSETYNELEVMVNSTGVNDTDPVTKDYVYGTAVSYKGNLYFKMDTAHPDLINKKIQWKVRTAGVTDSLSSDSWSVARTIYIYEKPTLSVGMTNDMAGVGGIIETLTSFPFYVRASDSLTDRTIQRPVGYHLQIVSNNYYVTADDAGRAKVINPGDAVYSKYFDTDKTLVVEMSANNIDLESGMNYTLYCTEHLSSGLTITNEHNFDVEWIDVEYAINAEVSINTDAYTALITPYCLDANGVLVENITLSAYRREYDGTYKEIASGIPNNYTSVTDPHPALDLARYRFTAKDSITGALSFWDMAGVPVNGEAIVLQWDEVWTTFDTGESTSVEGPEWSGSLLKLPYNIKVTDKRKPEVALEKYAGRRHPVSYYGTQVDETSQWSVDIPADDKETIYALRRLSLWTGDVYVREPSGMGYWANVDVSFNQSYDDVKIPISLDITRVEGGV